MEQKHSSMLNTPYNAKNRPPPHNKQIISFENKNLLMNLPEEPNFPVKHNLYKNLLSLAWENLFSYKRVFTVYASESKIKNIPNAPILY